MAKNPSTRWFFNDWMNEPGLRLCSVSARGLWMDMLCIAAAAERRGYLEVDGKACGVNDLARLANSPQTSVRRWLAELEHHGVFSRDPDGTIFNRRMVRENGNGVSRKSTTTPPKSPDREQDPKQPELFDNPEKTRTRTRDSDSGTFGTSPDSRLEVSSSFPGAAREQEGKEIENGDPEDASAARLGDRQRVHREPDAAITETPVGNGPAGVLMGVTDALPSMASATDYRGFDRQDQDHGVIAERVASTGAALPGRRRPVGPCGRSRPPPKPPDPRTPLRRQQIIVNLAEWLKIHSLGSVERQGEALRMLGRTRTALDRWHDRPPADKALWEELLAAMKADPLRRCGAAPESQRERTRRLAAIAFAGWTAPTQRWSALSGSPPCPTVSV